MTYKEAIIDLEQMKQTYLDMNICFSLVQSLNLAIETMEKQIPKKPIDCDGYHCPNCGARVDDDGRGYEQPYCMECSQAIDWSE